MGSQALHPPRIFQQVKNGITFHRIIMQSEALYPSRVLQQVKTWDHISQIYDAILSMIPSQNLPTGKELGSHFTGSQCDPKYDTPAKVFNLCTAGITFYRLTMRSQA